MYLICNIKSWLCTKWCESTSASQNIKKIKNVSNVLIFTFIFSHLADAFIQSDLQMRTIEEIKTNT